MTKTPEEPLGNILVSHQPTNYGVEGSIGLVNAPEDIHYLIASELMKNSPSAVLALSQSSARLRRATMSFVYKDLILRNELNDAKVLRAYTALVETFRGKDGCDVAKHVRTITVRDEIPTEDFILILDKIAECGTLRKLSWETTAHIPATVLEKLETTWPKLELSVCVLSRHYVEIAAQREMDIKLLSSPLLMNLTYTIYRGGHHAPTPACSEWPKFTQALIAGGHVRVLRIQTRTGSDGSGRLNMVNDNEPKKLMRLDIAPGMRLPPLEEFTLLDQRPYGDSTYLWDQEHCNMLRDTMDWSRIRKLDFGSEKPDAFFTAFTGQIPGLTHLRFGTGNESIGAVKRFLESVTALESLDIDRAQGAIFGLMPAIIKHNDTLRELILRPLRGQSRSQDYMSIRALTEITEQFPGLERLGWEVPYKANIDAEHLTLLSTMNLRKLDLFLNLPWEASDFSAALQQDMWGSIPAPCFEKETSKAAAIAIMETVSQAQEQPLEWLTLHFTRVGMYDRGQTYLMWAKMQVRRRIKEDRASGEEYEIRGKQEWEDVVGLREELSLNEEGDAFSERGVLNIGARL